MKIRRVVLTTPIANHTERRLALGARCRYPFTNTNIKTYDIPKGMSSFNWVNALAGISPHLIVTALVEQEAYNGWWGSNPYRFHHHDIEEFWYSVNSEVRPAGKYTPKWDSSEYLIDYRTMNDQLHAGRTNSGDQITPELWKNGCTIFPLDLSPHGCSGYHRHLSKHAVININGKFKTKPKKNLTVLLYYASHDEFYIDNDRRIFHDDTTAE